MNIHPYQGVGNLFFNDQREFVRQKINQPFESGSKGFEQISEEYDYFTALGLFVYYDKHGIATAFEFFEPGLEFEGQNLFEMTYRNLTDFFSALDAEIDIGYAEFTSNKFGIGGTCSDDPDDEDAKTEAIIIFRAGYYDANL